MGIGRAGVKGRGSVVSSLRTLLHTIHTVFDRAPLMTPSLAGLLLVLDRG
jgi:hypothetical protein